MSKKLILVVLAMAFFFVMPVAAQTSSSDINFQDILDSLGPRTGTALLFDILLYSIFFLGFINMMLIPDKQLFPSMLNFTILGLAIASKLLIEVKSDDPAFNPSAIMDATDFAVLPINVGMFVLPFIIAGMLRSVKGKPTKAVYPALLMGLLGGVYFFFFWSMEQNDPDQVPEPGDFQGALIISFVMAAPYLRYRWQQLKDLWNN